MIGRAFSTTGGETLFPPWRGRWFALHGTFSFCRAFSGDPLRQLLRSGFAVPFLEGLRRDLALDQELRELASLCLALERHRPILMVRQRELKPNLNHHSSFRRPPRGLTFQPKLWRHLAAAC